MSTPRIFTYHCTFCSHLLLATTHRVENLPRRKPPGLDSASILPLPPPPRGNVSSDSESSESEAEDEPTLEPPPDKIEDNTSTKGLAGGILRPPPPPRRRRDKNAYTVLLTLVRDRSAKIITREDGFEKRVFFRCPRCKLHVGYMLDEMHYDMGPKSETHPNTTIVGGGDAGADKDRAEKERQRLAAEREKYLYVLAGAVTETGQLGRDVPEREVDILGEGGE